ncbi:hypothetical protein PLICRDRAFT_31719 [Plicaturopsis crispa FD-325 SS-3]|nr:hypothetical protein PLICRDRAFT_31719 [Plicaturopsis crispa FD-325 SS-3]
MVNFTILAGGYTTFIAAYLFDSDASTLSLLNQSPTGDSPSWIALHPTNKSILYATNEVTQGALQTFSVGTDGVLAGPIDTISSGGDSPAFATPLSTGEVVVLNYGSGNGKIVPTTPDPEHFLQSAPLITFPVPTGGEGVSHPHMALEYKDELFVADLGGDKVWRLGNDGSENWTIHGFIEQPANSGPRHMAVYNDELYVLHELSSTLTVQAIPPAPNGTTPLLANVSIVPPNPPAGAAFAGGEINIPTHGKPFIYTSNRNTGTQDPRGDAISIYQRTASGLNLTGQVFTGIDQIRGMQIGPSDGDEADQYVIAGGVAGTAGVVVYKVTETGNLTEVARNTDLPTRTSFVWL